MVQVNETAAFTYAFLSDEHFSLAHRKFVESFSDYVVPFELTAGQFQNHILLNGVDLNSSVACFSAGDVVGITLNGFGDWKGVPTVYDAGTGVIAAFRRRGVGEAIFHFMFPTFMQRGIKQCLLEVISNNDPAVTLYKKLGFTIERRLMLLETLNSLRIHEDVLSTNDGLEMRDIEDFQPVLVEHMWDGMPSWQNSFDAIERSKAIKKITGAYIGEKCVGYIVYTKGYARVSQLAVDRDYRGRGIGSRLLFAMENDALKDKKLQIINIDTTMTDAVKFLQNRGYTTLFEQFEMIKEL